MKAIGQCYFKTWHGNGCQIRSSYQNENKIYCRKVLLNRRIGVVLLDLLAFIKFSWALWFWDRAESKMWSQVKLMRVGVYETRKQINYTVDLTKANALGTIVKRFGLSKRTQCFWSSNSNASNKNSNELLKGLCPIWTNCVWASKRLHCTFNR